MWVFTKHGFFRAVCAGCHAFAARMRDPKQSGLTAKA